MSCSNCRCFKMFQVSWWNYETMMKLMFQVVFFDENCETWQFSSFFLVMFWGHGSARSVACSPGLVAHPTNRAGSSVDIDLEQVGRAWKPWCFFFGDLLILWWCFCSQKKITKFSNKWFIVFHRFHWEFSFQNKVFISDPKSINMFFNGFFLLIYHWF